MHIIHSHTYIFLISTCNGMILLPSFVWGEPIPSNSLVEDDLSYLFTGTA